jgi:hypothetical protein
MIDHAKQLRAFALKHSDPERSGLTAAADEIEVLGETLAEQLEARKADADEIERLQCAIRDFSQAAFNAYTTLEAAGKAGLFDDVWDKHRDVIEACRATSVNATGDER